MKVVFITQGITRLTTPLFDSSMIDMVGVVENAGRKGAGEQSWLVEFMTKLSIAILPKSRLKQKYLKYLAEDKNIPYFYMDKGCSDELENWIESKSPDVIVVFSMSELLTENIFGCAKFGTINLHPSYLPDYRGPNPDFWQYYDMEMNPGMTVHYIDRGEDSGDIICQDRISIELGTKSPQRLDRLQGQLGVDLVLSALKQIANGTVKSYPQPAKSPTRRAKLVKKSQHLELIDWQNWDIERVWHVLRGTELWLDAIPPPKMFSLKYIGHRWDVGPKQVGNTQDYELGKVYHENGRYFVACKGGTITLTLNFNFNVFILGLLKSL